MKSLKRQFAVLLALCGLCALPDTVPAQTRSGPVPLAVPVATVPAKAAPAAKPAPAEKTAAFDYTAGQTAPKQFGLGTKLLWYLPNRFMDFVDIFRFRARIGPGLAVNMRMTDYGSFYIGKYNSIFVGLPGPRSPHYVRMPAGYERLNGVVLGGVDATDDTPYGPEYGPSEIDLGAHLLLVGAEIGIDPIEIGDFFAGIFMFDLVKDDYPKRKGPEPKLTSAVSRNSQVGMFRVNEKPATFSSFDARLDYMHTNVQMRVSEPVRTVDEYFMPDENLRENVPDTRMRLGLYIETTTGGGSSFSFQPDIDMDVKVPNIEKRLHIFVQSGNSDDLPSRTPGESDNQGLTAGIRQTYEKYDISTDVGIRWSWPPRGYARIQWAPKYLVDQWSFRPQQRFFIDTKEKLGSLTSLYVDRWIGDHKEYYVGTISSVKYTTEKEETSWEQSFRVGRMREMLADKTYTGRFDRRDVASGGDVKFSIFGTDGLVDTYRLTVGVRRPMYQKWIYWDIEPGIEWLEENDFDTSYRFTVGIDMMFWGPGGK